jgi:hypothetical protein
MRLRAHVGFNKSKPHVQREQNPCSLHRVHSCVLCESQTKWQVFLYTAVTDCFFLFEKESVYCAVRTEFCV